MTIRYSEEGPVPLETGGGILRALPLLGPEPFLVVSGDVWTDIDFARVQLQAGRARAPGARSPTRRTTRAGTSASRATSSSSADQERLTYANVGLYRPEFFAGCTAGRFPLIEPLNRAHRGAAGCAGKLHRGQWCDVGTPERLAALNATARCGTMSAMSSLKDIPVVAESRSPRSGDKYVTPQGFTAVRDGIKSRAAPAPPRPRLRKPPWLKARAPSGGGFSAVRALVQRASPRHGVRGGQVPEHR